MNRLPKNPDLFDLSGCYIAGGAILSLVTKTEINDYDIYPKSQSDFENILYKLTDEDCFIMNISDRAITLKSNSMKKDNGERTIVQVMFFDWFENSQKIFDKFDFTACMAAYDCDTKTYEFHPDFYPDVASKTLRFNQNTQFPVSSLLRTEKYKNKGFYLGKAESLKIAMCIAKDGLPQSWRELEKQIGGTYGRQLKLDTKDLPYTYDNVISILNDFEFNVRYDENSEGVDDTVEEIINYFTIENKEYIVCNGVGIFTDGYTLKDTFSGILLEEAGVPDNFKKSKHTNFFGYYSPYHSIDEYIGREYGAWTSASIIKDKSKLNPSNAYKYLVSFDINNISNGGHRASKIVVEKKIDLDTTMEDDIMSVMEEKICV